MDDTQMLDWIEHELQHHLGGGAWWNIEHEIHKGTPIRTAVMEEINRINRCFDIGEFDWSDLTG